MTAICQELLTASHTAGREAFIYTLYRIQERSHKFYTGTETLNSETLLCNNKHPRENEFAADYVMPNYVSPQH